MKKIFLAALFAAAAMVATTFTSCDKEGLDPGDSPTVTDNVHIAIRQSNSVGNIRDAVQQALNWASANGQYEVYVTGSKTGGRINFMLTFTNEVELYWSADYSGEAIQLDGEGEFYLKEGANMTLTTLAMTGNDVSAYVYDAGTLLTVNGDVICQSSGSGRLLAKNNAEIKINGHVTYSGSNDFDLMANDGAKITVTGNVTGTSDYNNDFLVWCGGSEITIGGNLSGRGENELVGISGGGKIVVGGNVSASYGYLAYIYGAGSKLTVNGTATVQDDNEYIEGEFTGGWNFVPKTPLPSTTAIGGVTYYDYTGSASGSNYDWHVYVKQ